METLKTLLIIMIFISGYMPSAGINQNYDTIIDNANKAYTDGNYTEAVKMYEQALAGGYESPEVYYNLGNAHFKSGNLPATILNYEKAKRLSPNDEDISFNLRLARLRTVDKIEPIPEFFYNNIWNKLSEINSSSGWSSVSITLFWVCILSFIAYLLSLNVIYKKIYFALFLIFLILSASGLGLALKRYTIETNRAEGIIFTPSVTIKSSPNEKGTDLFVLHEGTKIEILDSLSMWRKIRLADGSIGWLMANTIEVI